MQLSRQAAPATVGAPVLLAKGIGRLALVGAAVAKLVLFDLAAPVGIARA